MHFRSLVRAGLALAVLGLAPAAFWQGTPAVAAPAAGKNKPAPKAAPKPAPKPRTAVGKTPSETIQNLIAAMQRQDRDVIATAFNWQRFAEDLNRMLPGENGLDAGIYKTMVVESLIVEKSVATSLRVGAETKKNPTTATVEFRRIFPSGSGGSEQIRTISTYSLAKEKEGWRIIGQVFAQNATVPPPPVRQAPQGMVPAAGTDR